MDQFSTQALIQKGADAGGGPGLDKAKLARYLLMLVAGLAIAYAAEKLILPWFKDFVWDMTQIIIYGGIGAIVLALLLSQWHNITSFFDILADMGFGKLIRMAPFRMQEKKIELAEANYTQVQNDYGKLKGAYDRVESEYERQVQLYNEGVAGEKIAKTDEDKYTQQKKQQRAGGFVQILKPQRENMQNLVEVTQLGLKRMKQMIADAKIDLQESKTVFEVTMTGASAMAHMMAAMQGNAQVNSDAERATLAVMRRISLAVGQTQAAMEIVSDITKASNLEDASKLAVARDQLKALGTSDISSLPVAPGALHYQGMVKQMDTRFPLD